MVILACNLHTDLGGPCSQPATWHVLTLYGWIAVCDAHYQEFKATDLSGEAHEIA